QDLGNLWSFSRNLNFLKSRPAIQQNTNFPCGIVPQGNIAWVKLLMSGSILQGSNLEREIPGGSEETSVREDTNVSMVSGLVGPGWMKFYCKSGELLFYYNKDTAEHKFPMWNSTSREYCMGETIDGELLQTNKNNSIAIQTDDTGCSNGCTSMYAENGGILQESNLEREIPGGSEQTS
ncbi:hypothetical protein QZH41_019293, partial [Actinostola sp. cb2023]